MTDTAATSSSDPPRPRRNVPKPIDVTHRGVPGRPPQSGKDNHDSMHSSTACAPDSPSSPARTAAPSAPDSTPGPSRSSPATTSNATWSSAPSTSPGSSTAPIAPGPHGSRPTSCRPAPRRPSRRPTRSWCWDVASSGTPADRSNSTPSSAASLGSPMRVSWSQDIEDPDEPGRLVNRLEGTALGCAWLLDRWNELRDLLEDGLKWQAPDRFKATRLLGKQPLEPIDDLQVRWIHLCASAMDPECEHEFGDVTNELHSAEWERFVERLEARDAWREKPEDAEVARAALLELVSEQEERLETLLAAHLERESAADPDALGFQDTAEGERLRRYQMACNRTLLRILETLRKRHREADQAKEGGKRGRKSSGAASGVESSDRGGPAARDLRPGDRAGSGDPRQQSEVVLSDDSARRDPGPRPSCWATVSRPRPQPDRRSPDPRERDERSHRPSWSGSDSPAPSRRKSLPPIFTDHSPGTNEATDPARSDAGPLAAALARLALLLLVGLSTAFAASAGVIGPDSSPRMPRDTTGLQVAARKGLRRSTRHVPGPSASDRHASSRCPGASDGESFRSDETCRGHSR